MDDECENIVLESWPDIELEALERIICDLDSNAEAKVDSEISPKAILRVPPINSNSSYGQLQYLPRAIPEQKRAQSTEEAGTMRKMQQQIKELSEELSTLKEQIKIKDDQIVTLFYSHRHKITKLEEFVYNNNNNVMSNVNQDKNKR